MRRRLVNHNQTGAIDIDQRCPNRYDLRPGGDTAPEFCWPEKLKTDPRQRRVRGEGDIRGKGIDPPEKADGTNLPKEQENQTDPTRHPHGPINLGKSPSSDVG